MINTSVKLKRGISMNDGLIKTCLLLMIAVMVYLSTIEDPVEVHYEKDSGTKVYRIERPAS